MKKEITFQDYEKIEICSGTILEASINVKAKKPAYVLKIDFGEKIGIKTSSAQITHYYGARELQARPRLARPAPTRASSRRPPCARWPRGRGA